VIKKLLSLIIVFGVFASMMPNVIAAQTDEPIAVVYHTGDIGGCLFSDDVSIGADTLAAIVNSAKSDNEATFLFDTGDSVQGNFFVNSDEGKNAVEIMNSVGYDAMCLGNHEFDYGFERLIELAESANFPFLTQEFVANENNALKSSVIIDRGGVKIGIFGITTPSTHYTSGGGFERDFGTVSELINYSVAKARELRDDGADIVVCLSHMGVDDNQARDYGSAYDIADNALGIDVIIDGHTPESEVKIQNEFTTPISSVGDAASEIGVIKFYRKNGEITTEISSIKKAETLDIIPDEEVSLLLENEQNDFNQVAQTVVGYSPVSLNDYEKPIIRSEESVLADVVADSMKWFTGADIAFCNAGNIRAPLDEGDITLGEIQNILPYMNNVCTADVKGSIIREALSHSADFYGTENGGFMQVSGLSYTIDINKPLGERLASVTVNSEPLDDNKVYNLAVFDFIIDGGDGYVMLEDSFLNNSTTHGTIIEAFSGYLSESENFVNEKQGRIIIKSTDETVSDNNSVLFTVIIVGAAVIIAITVIILIKKRK
jgi:5'-nucleotidase